MNVLKKFKLAFFYTFSIMSLFPVFLGCNNDIDVKDNFASVSIYLGNGSKALSASESLENLSFRYTVLKDSETPEPENLWKVLNVVNNSASVENLKPGSCRIFLNAYQNSVKILTGNADVVLVPGQNNSVVINLLPVGESVQGTVSVNITGDCSALKVVCQRVNNPEKKEIQLTSSGSTTKRFTGTENLPAGSWIAEIVFFKNGVQAGGETLAFEVNPAGAVTLSGSLGSGLTYTTGNDILSTISRSIEVGKSETFTYCSNGTNCRYRWYLDDESSPVSTSASYTFNSDKAGTHRIRCFVNDSLNPYLCVVSSYHKKTITVTLKDLADTYSDSSQICFGFKRNGVLLAPDLDYPFEYTNPAFDELTDCSQVGLEPVYPASEADYANTYLIIIGSKANLTSSSSKGWMGQAMARKSNSKLSYLFCYRDIDDYAFYGCSGLFADFVHLGPDVKHVGAYSFGHTQVKTAESITDKGENVVFDNLAFTKLT